MQISNLVDDPSLRFTPQGHAVAEFTVASTPRYFDRRANDWRDAEPLFLRCVIWRDAAENLAESVGRGARVIVTGRLRQRRWKTDDGQDRTTTELEVDEVGPSLRRATAKVTRTTPRGGSARDFVNSGASGEEAWTGQAASSSAGADSGF
ncbi:single-stranded DNA-binding protein [Nocardia sp. NPDC057227]|uniref:single-stranded DNA-binding protein n=1 Tax=Nocardia sp. NPDC057227 TaxID=3346056 RepID=UPI00362638FB